MKKLMIAAAIVCAAAMSQAATVTWQQVDGPIYDGMGENAAELADDTVVYLIAASYTVGQDTFGFSQSDFAAAYNTAKGDKAATLEAVGGNLLTGTGVTVMDGYIDSTDSTFTQAGLDAYYVIFNGDQAYISAVETALVDALDTTVSTLKFYAPENSEALAIKASEYVSGDGWIKAETVPEPTSGLLLLIGMAGLALRRRRA